MPSDLSKFSGVRTYPKGTVVARPGEASPRELLILLQGNLGVYQNYGLNHQVQTAVLGQGGFYGEHNLFLNREQSETLVALTDVILLAVSRRNVMEFFTQQSETAFTVVEGICKKLETADLSLEKLQAGTIRQQASQKSAFFPEGHGSYLLPIQNDNDYFLYSRKYTCPLCGSGFVELAYLASRLQTASIDPDLRVHYRDFEPLYYDIVTCPHCFFSTDSQEFEETSRGFAQRINEAIGPYKLDLQIRTGPERDTYTVFAGYYLALLCAPVIHDNHQLNTAGLWLKLSRLYRDCSDEAMDRYCCEKALEDFRYAYEYLKISEKATQRVCYFMADLLLKQGNLDEARTFFHQAKTNKAGTAVIQRQADLRLEEIRERKRSETVSSR